MTNHVIGDRQRINIIVGENGIGKTRLLHKLYNDSENAVFLDQTISNSTIVSMRKVLYKYGIEPEYYSKKIIDVLKNLDPKITGLFLVEGDGDILILRKGHDYFVLDSMGQGFKKLFYYTFMLLTHNNCTMMIDEIENGLYTDTLDIVWQTINHYSKRNNIQCFIVTHSMECIESFVDNVTDTDIALYRLEEERIVRHDREQLLFAIERGWKIR